MRRIDPEELLQLASALTNVHQRIVNGEIESVSGSFACEHAHGYFILNSDLAVTFKEDKRCPECWETEFVLLRSQNKKVCCNCGHKLDWLLSEGQSPQIGNNRQKDER